MNANSLAARYLEILALRATLNTNTGEYLDKDGRKKLEGRLQDLRYELWGVERDPY